eukprot:Nitzschia sp. Nitz4//scaffold207_size38617//10218//11372//NITZ4_007674-RA/size38617-processed-gene-0.30-mRNA-1//1//CDS//3329541602//4159//frame0
MNWIFRASFFTLASLALFSASTEAFTEEERVAEYHARNYTWPVPKFIPDFDGWDKLMRSRLQQVSEIENLEERFEGYAQTLSAGMLQPRFTDYGFGLTKAPEDLMVALRQAIQDGLAEGPKEEYYIPVIDGAQRPWMIERPDLMKRVLEELHPYPEAWAGVELTPEVAYGIRLYRNQSTLYMHADKPETHVVSFILHIGSSEDADPWPLLIEDFQGNSHEITLKSGDMVFYESSKAFHGRPRPLNGSWYSSIFVHYYPKYGYKENFHIHNKVWAIPPHWDQPPQTEGSVKIKMHGTGFEEPECPNNWCATEYSKKWSGPGEEGYWIAPTGEKFPLDVSRPACYDVDPYCGKYIERNADECNANPKYMLEKCAKICGACSVEAEL